MKEFKQGGNLQSYERRVRTNWIDVMNKKLEQIEKNKTWELTPRPVRKNIIGTKLVLKNKMNKNGQVVRNKSILVGKGYSQIEGIYYEDNFTPVMRMEAIMMFFPLCATMISRCTKWM